MSLIKYLRRRWHNDVTSRIELESNEILDVLNDIKQTASAKTIQEDMRVIASELLRELDTMKQIISDANTRITQLQDGILRSMPRRTLRFAVDIIDKCNLNCRGCLTFSPCARRAVATVVEPEQFDSDLKRISELFDKSEVQVISISGGEPLLHPRVHEFAHIVRRYFSETNIRLITNGLLLLTQPESFWNSCKEDNVTIEQTKYPINLDFEKIQETASLHGVEHVFFADTGESQKTLRMFPVDISKMSEDTLISQNERIHFFKCWEANTCLRLSNGKLYTCSRVPHINLFNECFGTKLPVSENDGIDIYKAKNREEIYDFLARPIPFCRFCEVDKITDGHPWSQSELSIEEWTV